MNHIIKVFFSMSLSGSLLILVLFFCKPLLKNRTSKQWQYYIWLIAIARLLLPFTPETSLMGILFGQTGQAPPLISAFPAPENTMPSSSMDGSAAIENRTLQPEESSLQTENVLPRPDDTDTSGSETASAPAAETAGLQYLWLIWPGAALLLLMRKITVYQSFTAYIKAGRKEASDIGRLNQLAQFGAQAGVKRPVELYTNNLISSPLLLGFFRPCIVLPTLDLPDADFRYTVWHELTHYKRLDMFYKWLVQITICLHWFNPLVWLMGRELCRACELSCDEAVIRALDLQERRAYGDTLLHALETGGSYKNSIASATLGESAELLKERLKAIMDYKKGTGIITALSLIFTVLLAAGATVSGTAMASESSAALRTDAISKNDAVPETGTAPGTGTASGLSAKYTDNSILRMQSPDRGIPSPALSDVAADDGNVSMDTLDLNGITYYLVCNEAQLRAIGTGRYSLNGDYMQQADILLSEDEWIPIGTREHPFSGSYNGNGFEITGLTMTDPDAELIGLFGAAQNAHIYNITMRDYDIMKAGQNVPGRSVAPILALGLGNVRSYDLFAYPKESETDDKGHAASDPAVLAETCYKYGNLSQFAIAFASLDEDARETWLDKIYDDGAIAFFSVSLQQLDADSPLITSLANTAYEDGQINFFSVSLQQSDTDSPLITSLANTAYEDGQINFFSVLTDHMGRETLESWLDKALQEQRYNFQSVLFTALGREQELCKAEAELKAKSLMEYEDYGITMDGKAYYYQSQPVKVFLDMRANGYSCTLDMNPNGTVSIKVTRDDADNIERVDYMTEEELHALFGNMVDDMDDIDDLDDAGNMDDLDDN